MNSLVLTNLIQHINSLVEKSIIHGGDCGGPYFSWGEPVKEELLSIIKDLHLENIYDVYEDSSGYYSIDTKENINKRQAYEF